MNLDAEIAAAREHLHRSIGQRARWARYAIAERTERERAVMHRALNRICEPPPPHPLANAYPWTREEQMGYYARMQNADPWRHWPIEDRRNALYGINHLFDPNFNGVQCTPRNY